MNIAVMHYHLRPGGVTSVIGRQVEALQKYCGNDIDVLVVTGQAAVDNKGNPCRPDFDTAVIPGIAYDTEISSPVSPHETAEAIFRAIRDKWPEKGCDLLHAHNATLAKNRDLLKILKWLQNKGVALFLHLHDFAEDGRPNAYFKDDYPRDCHYGVINGRDFEILKASGAGRNGGLHLLPNAVRPLEAGESIGQGVEGDPYVLYPVRAIRRKNIWEAALLTFFLDCPLYITLPPTSPSDVKPYGEFTSFVKKEGLPIKTEVGLSRNFHELVQGAKFILSTSIMEGFGFSFLEPWTAFKTVTGRYLPGIVDDFEAAGMEFPHMYKRLAVPLEWVGRDFVGDFEKQFMEKVGAYGLLVDREKVRASIRRITADDAVDMGVLNEFRQIKVLKKMLKESEALKTLLELNPVLEKMSIIGSRSHEENKLCVRNRKIILEKYSLETYGKQLKKIYDDILIRPVGFCINKQTLLNSFLKPETFSLLKWGKP